MNKTDPSNPISCFQYPDFQIVDNAGIFKPPISGDLGYSRDSKGFKVLENKINLYLYTSIGERPDWKSINLSSNDIAVFIFKSPVQLEFRIKLSDNLCLLSKFSRSIQEMLNYKVILYEKDLTDKKLSIKYVLSLFDTLEEPLFNIVSNKEAEITAKKSIKISKRGSLDFVPSKPIAGKLNVAIGLFFDGTGNNKFNTEKVHNVIANELAKEENKKKCFSDLVTDYQSNLPDTFQKFMVEEKSSYLNSYSNIVELFDLYKGVNVKDKDFESKRFGIDKEIILKLYIEGIGTKQGEKDSYAGAGIGRGDYGVLYRCLEAISEVAKKLMELQKKQKQDKEEIEFGKVIFDVFGFSRGAAAARLFYVVLFGNSFENFTDKSVFDNILFNYYYLKKLVKQGTLKIRFYGLFDTVLSTNIAHKIFHTEDYPKETDISLNKCNAPCYHIIAQDEIRENFPLTHVDAENCVQLELFGCHSNIGGGYTRDKFSASFAYDELEKSQPTNTFVKLYNDYKLRYAVDTSKRYLSHFVGQISYKYKQERDNPNEGSLRLKGYVAMDKRLIECDVSKISLQAMLLFASQHKLPFKEFEFQYSSKLSAEDKKALSEYKNLVEKTIDDLKNGCEKTDYLKEKKDFFNLYHKFIHISESYESQIFSSMYNGKINEYGNLLYSDRPTEKRIRVEYLK